MNPHTNNWSAHLTSTTRGLIYFLLFFLPLFSLPFTIDRIELNKQTLLLVLTFVAALSWIGSMLVSKRFVFRRGWINFFLTVLIVAFGISAWYSSAPFLSWVGGSTQEYTSFLTIVGLSLLYYLIVNTLSEQKAHRIVYFLLILSAVFSAGFAFGDLFIGEEIFNPIGTLSSAGVFLISMTVLALSLWISHRKSDSLMYKGTTGVIEQGLIILLCLLVFAYLLALDDGFLWLLLELGLAILFAFVFFRSRDFSSVGRFFLPILLCVGALPFWFWLSSPFSVSLPSQVTLNSQTSQEIAKSSLDQGNPFFGSGPGTYLFVYAKEHSEAVNQTNFFDTRFDRAASFFFTLLPTIGLVGSASLLLFFVAMGIYGVVFILKARSRESGLSVLIAFTPWAVLVLSAFLFEFNFTLVAFIFLFSALMGSQVLTVSPLTRKESLAKIRFASFFLLAAGAFAFFVGIFVISQRYLAEVAFAKAVRADRQGTSLSEVIGWLDTAATLNRFDDRSYRVLAETLLLRINEQLHNVSSTAELTQESQSYVQALVGAAVNASVKATDLSPKNSVNWLVRGKVYRELMNVIPNASPFAISAFEKVIELDPVNPSHWNELGMAYLAAAERERPLIVAQDKQLANQAQALVDDFMKKGEAALEKAIELKSNYAPAHYQLSLTYERQGRLDEAILKMESVAKYNPQDVGVAFQLGQLYLRRAFSGDFVRAKNAFEYAITLAPSYSNARWFLASIYEQEGNVKGAIEQIEKVLELNPDNQLVKTRLDRIVNGQISNEALAPLP